MKCVRHALRCRLSRVAPCAGAWIEIVCADKTVERAPVAPCAGAWIEMAISPALYAACESPPARGRGLKLSAH